MEEKGTKQAQSDYAPAEKTEVESAKQDKGPLKVDEQISLDYPTMNQENTVNDWEAPDHEVGLLTSVQVERYDVIKQLAVRIKRSVSFLVLYVILIIANAFVLIWELSGRENHIALILMEALINLIFTIEITVEILTQGKTAFFQKTWNMIDFTICIFCLFFFVVFCFEEAPKTRSGITSYFDGILLMIRYLIQLVRLVRFAKNAQYNRHIQSQDDVIFSERIDFQERFPRL